MITYLNLLDDFVKESNKRYRSRPKGMINALIRNIHIVWIKSTSFEAAAKTRKKIATYGY